MLPLIAALLFTALLLFAPRLWVKHVFKRHGAPLAQLPGNGGELAIHLLARLGFDDINTIVTERGDHYDPNEKAVCLSESTYHGKSLTAVAIAAHEVGHAIQHKRAYKPMLIRNHLGRYIGMAEKIAGCILVSSPFAAFLIKQPVIGGLMMLSGIVILLLPVLFHLLTLPVEWDASFKRALPILIHGKYLPPQQRTRCPPHPRRRRLDVSLHLPVQHPELLSMDGVLASLTRRPPSSPLPRHSRASLTAPSFQTVRQPRPCNGRRGGLWGGMRGQGCPRHKPKETLLNPPLSCIIP